MPDNKLPLLLFPRPSKAEREKRASGFSRMHFPTSARQQERLNPKFDALRAAFDSKRIQLQGASPGDHPELVIVFETVGAIDKFLGAVQRIDGLEWLAEHIESNIEPDEDFFSVSDEDRPLSATLFLLGSNRQALVEIVSLWSKYRTNPTVNLGFGFNKWKDVFKQLKDLRFWGPKDRLGSDVAEYLSSKLAQQASTVVFEIEAWCFSSASKNLQSRTEVAALVNELGGRILDSALIPEIAYHAFLVELPAQGASQLLSDVPPMLVLCERIMFLRPQGQALSPRDEDEARLAGFAPRPDLPVGDPQVALFDGLPVENHPLLAGRIIVDDPDGWAADYEVGDRVHGTAMASLISHGELDGATATLGRPIYVRPILKPDPADFRKPRQESTPHDVLLLDLVHRAVRRLFDGENGEAGVASKIRAINISIGNPELAYSRDVSPWSRLVDWLSHKYRVLFVISAGNNSPELELPVERDRFGSLLPEQQKMLAISALLSEPAKRRLLSPAESMNALTVGAVHSDASTLPKTPSRFNVFREGGITGYSCIGHGHRRSVKPDILMPGGRALHSVVLPGVPTSTTIRIVNSSSNPGHRVAAPPDGAGGNTKYCRGTSNAAALASRGAAFALEVIENLRASDPDKLPPEFDAVLLKALLAHGAQWGPLRELVLASRPDITDWRKQSDLVTRIVGYGFADVEKALSCTEQRATLIGLGQLANEEALVFRAPLPPCLNAKLVKKRLIITLAWLTPVNSRNAKYRVARLWVKPPGDAMNATRTDCDWQQVQRGTLQHEILEGNAAMAFVDGDELVFKVNCMADGGKIVEPIQFALCVSLEVAEGLALPIYQEVRQRVAARVSVRA
jgi:hypothetical protein